MATTLYEIENKLNEGLGVRNELIPVAREITNKIWEDAITQGRGFDDGMEQPTEGTITIENVGFIGEIIVGYKLVEDFYDLENSWTDDDLYLNSQLYDNKIFISSSDVDIFISSLYDKDKIEGIVVHEIKHVWDEYIRLKNNINFDLSDTLTYKVHDVNENNDVAELFYLTGETRELETFTQQSWKQMKQNDGDYTETELYKKYKWLLGRQEHLNKKEKEGKKVLKYYLDYLLDFYPDGWSREKAEKDYRRRLSDGIKNYGRNIGRLRARYEEYKKGNINENTTMDVSDVEADLIPVSKKITELIKRDVSTKQQWDSYVENNEKIEFMIGVVEITGYDDWKWLDTINVQYIKYIDKKSYSNDKASGGITGESFKFDINNKRLHTDPGEVSILIPFINENEIYPMVVHELTHVLEIYEKELNNTPRYYNNSKNEKEEIKKLFDYISPSDVRAYTNQSIAQIEDGVPLKNTIAYYNREKLGELSFDKNFRNEIGENNYKDLLDGILIYNSIIERLENIQRKRNTKNENIDNIIENTIKQLLKQAEKETDTNPSEAQAQVGNYKKGRINIKGLDIVIENPKGSYRRGTDGSGRKWKVKMNNTYGYFAKTKAIDGDALDVFLGDDLESDKVFCIDQYKDDKFDETKVMMGFNTEKDAKEAYLSNYEKGWKGLKHITELDIETFIEWLDNHKEKKQRKPIAHYKSLVENTIMNEGLSDKLYHFTNPIGLAKDIIKRDMGFNKKVQEYNIDDFVKESLVYWNVDNAAPGVEEYEIGMNVEDIVEQTELLSEATAEEIHQKYYSNINEDEFYQIIKAGNVNDSVNKVGPHARWLLNLYRNGNLRLEDLYKAKEYLRRFDELKCNINDLKNYKSLSDLYKNVVEPNAQKEVETSKKQQIQQTKQEGAETVYEDGNWLAKHIKTKKAAIYYGKGTQWCTAATGSDNYFEDYNKKGPLYVIIDKQDNSKYQFHYETNQYMDETDSPIDFSEHEYLLPILGKLQPTQRMVVEVGGYNAGILDKNGEWVIDPNGVKFVEYVDNVGKGEIYIVESEDDEDGCYVKNIDTDEYIIPPGKHQYIYIVYAINKFLNGRTYSAGSIYDLDGKLLYEDEKMGVVDDQWYNDNESIFGKTQPYLIISNKERSKKLIFDPHKNEKSKIYRDISPVQIVTGEKFNGEFVVTDFSSSGAIYSGRKSLIRGTSEVLIPFDYDFKEIKFVQDHYNLYINIPEDEKQGMTYLDDFYGIYKDGKIIKNSDHLNKINNENINIDKIVLDILNEDDVRFGRFDSIKDTAKSAKTLRQIDYDEDERMDPEDRIEAPQEHKIKLMIDIINNKIHRPVERYMTLLYVLGDKNVDLSFIEDESYKRKIDDAIEIINSRLRTSKSMYAIYTYVFSEVDQSNMTNSQYLELRNRLKRLKKLTADQRNCLRNTVMEAVENVVNGKNFREIIVNDDASRIIRDMSETGELYLIIPELKEQLMMHNSPYHSPTNILEHTLRVFSETCATTNDYCSRMAALLHDIGKPFSYQEKPDGTYSYIGHDKIGESKAEEILRRLGNTEDEIETILWIISNHMRANSMMGTKKEYKKREFAGHKHMEKALPVFNADSKGEYGKWFDDLKKKYGEFLPKPEVTEEDLLAKGYVQGPKLQELLRQKYITQLNRTPELNMSESVSIEDIVSETLYENNIQRPTLFKDGEKQKTDFDKHLAEVLSESMDTIYFDNIGMSLDDVKNIVVNTYTNQSSGMDIYPGYNPEDYEEDDDDTFFVSEEQFNNYCIQVGDYFDSMGNQVVIYRAIGVDKIDKINYDMLGDCWSGEFESAKAFGSHLCSPFVILKGVVDSNNVDWKSCVELYVLFSGGGDVDDENEIRIIDDTQIKNIEIVFKSKNVTESVEKIITETVQKILLEATAEQIYIKYYSDINREEFDKIVAAGNKDGNINKVGPHAKWLLDLYKNKRLKLEDLYKAKEYLRRFNELKRNTNELKQYTSLAELYKNVIGPNAQAEVELSKKQEIQQVKQEGAEKLYEDGEWVVVHPKTREAAIYYGKGTQWCTSATGTDEDGNSINAFDTYNEQGPLYIIINKKNGRKLQYHKQSDSFMNEEDDTTEPTDPFMKTIPDSVWKIIGFDNFSKYELWYFGYCEMDYPFEELGIKVYRSSGYMLYREGWENPIYKLDRNATPTVDYNENYIMLKLGLSRFHDKTVHFYDRYNVKEGKEEGDRLLMVKQLRYVNYNTQFYFLLDYGIYDLERDEWSSWPSEMSSDEIDNIRTVQYNNGFLYIFTFDNDDWIKFSRGEGPEEFVKVFKIPRSSNNCVGIENVAEQSMYGKIDYKKSWFFSNSNQSSNIENIVKNEIRNIIPNLFEDNKRLKDRTFEIPEELYQELINKYNKIKDNPNFTTRQNYKRLKNIIDRKGKISYKWMYTFVDWRDNYKGVLGGENQDVEAWLISADKFMDWVDAELKQATQSIEMSDDASSNIAFTTTYYS